MLLIEGLAAGWVLAGIAAVAGFAVGYRLGTFQVLAQVHHTQWHTTRLRDGTIVAHSDLCGYVGPLTGAG